MTHFTFFVGISMWMFLAPLPFLPVLLRFFIPFTLHRSFALFRLKVKVEETLISHCVHPQPSTTPNSWILHQKLIGSFSVAHPTGIYQLSEQGCHLILWVSFNLLCKSLPSLFGVCIQYNTRSRRVASNGEGLGTSITWMTFGGRRGEGGGAVPILQTHVQ